MSLAAVTPAMQRLVAAVSRIGADPNDAPALRLQKAIQVNTIVFGGLPFQIGLALFFASIGARVAAWEVGVFAALTLGDLLWFAKAKQRYHSFCFTQLCIAIMSPTLGALVLGGSTASGLVQIWGILAPLLAMMFYPPREALRWLLFFMLAIVAVALAEPYLPVIDRLPPTVQTILTVVNLISVTGIIFGALYYAIFERDRAYQLLRGEQAKAENLLLNILPSEIAAILKDEQRTIADHFEQASILFADVVNFTPLSAQLSPAELVQLLNEVFSHFDALVEKYGLEKIKTIGDCYMVASGVPRPRPDHAQALAQMALDMQTFVAQHKFQGRQLAFRIGLNSGPVVAGVIGRKKFIYDLWGDAVNTASRMESHGQSGVIQITHATYELLKADFICEPRGVVNVKGKGEMEVWQVLGQKTDK